MNNQENENSSTEDKCANCGETDVETFWTYDDGSMLCESCHKEMGDEWNERILAESDAEDEDDEEIPIKTTHKKSKSNLSSGRNKTMKRYIIGSAVFIIGLILLFSAKTILAGGTSNGVDYSTNQVTTNNLAGNGNVAATGAGAGNTQNVKLALVDFSYKLTPNKLVKGVPVRIEVDASTLSGCMKTVVIRDFGVNKYIKPGDNIIEFTPDKTGIFWITCGMGMGPGSFEVVNSDGTSDPNAKAQATASKPPSGGSCGASGGGCGCGGG